MRRFHAQTSGFFCQHGHFRKKALRFRSRCQRSDVFLSKIHVHSGGKPAFEVGDFFFFCSESDAQIRSQDMKKKLLRLLENERKMNAPLYFLHEKNSN